MRRRRLLRAVAAAGRLSGASAVAGCLGSDSADDGTATSERTRTTSERTTAATPTETPTLAQRGIPGDICQQRQQNPGGENIAAVIDPAFAPDWSGVEIDGQYTPGRENGRLSPESVVVGRVEGDRARAYPLAVLWWHEIVNDTFGPPTLVTYCPLCRSGLVAERVVGGQPTTFTVTELLWTPPSQATNESVESGTAFGANFNETEAGVRKDRGNLVMVDRATGSYWSQLLARAICGDRTGDRLPILPARTARWGDWQAEYPATDVLLPPPHSEVSIV